MAVAQSRCTMQRPQRPQTQGCVIVLAQSFARCETNRASTIRQPRPTSTTTNRHSPAFWCGGCENMQLAGKARMPYKMNTQSFKQGCIKTATQSRCTMQRHKWLSLHRCNGTNGCHCTDATAQMAVGARTRRPQRPQTQGCVIVLAQSFARCETNRASTIRQPRPTSTTTNRHSPAFWCWGANSHCASKARMPYNERPKF